MIYILYIYLNHLPNLRVSCLDVVQVEWILNCCTFCHEFQGTLNGNSVLKDMKTVKQNFNIKNLPN